jgi:cell division protein ZipA
MDIKDWILLGGGLLLVAVIAHGFWVAWRGRQNTLRMDIDPNVPREDIDPFDLLRAELPNGPARVRRVDSTPPHQRDLDLGSAGGALASKTRKPIVPERKTTTRRDPKTRPIVPARGHERTDDALASTRSSAPSPEGVIEPQAGPAKPALPSEVIVINVLARNGENFGGSDLLEAFLRNGLKFGDMNIFHRIVPGSKEVRFSVASALEPGTFDLSAIEAFRTPGVSFFMQMPGPDDPLEIFEDMLAVTRDVAASLGADLKDDQLSVMTSQTIAHCRARIEDFSRKRMSQRA